MRAKTHLSASYLRANLFPVVVTMAFFSCCASAATGPNTSATGDFYFAPSGNDAWPGTLSQPFRSVDRARVAVQGLKTRLSGRTIVVRIRNGTYYLPSTWTFTAEDSGTATTPILYANYPG